MASTEHSFQKKIRPIMVNLTGEETNCSLTSIAPIYGKTADELKKQVIEKYKLPSFTSAEELFAKMAAIPGSNYTCQIEGIKRYCADIYKADSSAPKIIGSFDLEFNKNDMAVKKTLYASLLKYPSNSSFVVFMASNLFLDIRKIGAHYVYGQRNDSGEIVFIDFQRDSPEDFPEVLDEPMCSPLIKNGAKKISEIKGCSFFVKILVFNTIAPEEIQYKISLLKSIKNGGLSNDLQKIDAVTRNNLAHKIALGESYYEFLPVIVQNCIVKFFEKNKDGLTPMELANTGDCQDSCRVKQSKVTLLAA